VLLTLGRLSADSEITAMRAAGLSVARVTRPVVLLALLGVGVGLYFNFESMPRARVEYHKALAEAISSNPLSLVIPKTFIRDFPGIVVYVGENQGGIMRDIWLWELDKDRRVIRIVRAAAGHFQYEESANSLILTLFQAQAEIRSEKHPENFDDPPMVFSVEKSEPYPLSLDRFFGRASGPRMKQEWMTYQELNTERARVAALPLPTDPVRAHTATLDRSLRWSIRINSTRHWRSSPLHWWAFLSASKCRVAKRPRTSPWRWL
jgi:lipopolysaccharide export system permease protein